MVHTVKYGNIFTTDTKTVGYYVVKFLPNADTLQRYNTTYGKVFKSCYLEVTAGYISSMIANINWH